MRAERRMLSAHAVQSASTNIADELCSIPAVRRATSIAIYFAAFGEVDCSLFADRMEDRGKTVYAPILRKKHMQFAPAGKYRRCVLNRYGIAEPIWKQHELRAASQLDIIITPLVAFDTKLNRIGMGGGYYDRALQFKKHRLHWRRPLAIGVAYSFQRVDDIEARPWDIPLDAVITEKESYGSY